MKYYLAILFTTILVFSSVFSNSTDDVDRNILGGWSWNNESETAYLSLEIVGDGNEYIGAYCYTTATRINCEYGDRKSLSLTKKPNSSVNFTGVLINPYDLKKVNISISVNDNELIWKKVDADSSALYVPELVKMKKTVEKNLDSNF